MKTMGKNKSFEFRSEWLDIIHSLEKESQLAVFDALACKMLGRRCPALSKQQRSVIDTIIQLSNNGEDVTTIKTPSFVPPTVEDVHNFCIAKQIYDVDAVMWWNYYNSKGWMVGRNKMKSWQSAVYTWHRRSNNNNQYGRTQQQNRSQSAINAGETAAERTIREIYGV